MSDDRPCSDPYSNAIQLPETIQVHQIRSAVDKAFERAVDTMGQLSRHTMTQELVDLFSAMATAREHRCSGCHRQWKGWQSVANLCGDCWRKAMPTLFGWPEANKPSGMSGHGVQPCGCIYVYGHWGESCKAHAHLNEPPK